MKYLINKKLINKYILIVYTFLLFAFVVLKLYKGVGVIDERNHIIRDRLDGYMNVNLTPFKTIKRIFNFDYGFNMPNILGNTLPFILFGIFISLSETKFSISKSLLFSVLIILFFELVQFITCMGFFDIDDIILNTLSSLIGIIIFYLFMVWRNLKK